MVNQTIVNLTTKTISKKEKRTLCLGISFCPAVPMNYMDSKIDVFKLCRKLKLRKWHKLKPAKSREHHHGERPIHNEELTIGDIDTMVILHELENDPEGTQMNSDALLILDEMEIRHDKAACTGFKPKSTFLPSMGHDNIDTLLEQVGNDLLNFRQKNWSKKMRNYKHNLTKAQKKAMNDLATDVSIVVRPADKWGNIVILSRDMYVAEATRQLNDSSTYMRSTRIE